MPHQKVLGNAGKTLADIYDVDGSIVDIEELDSASVKTVHEMGGTIFAERIEGHILTASTGDIAQTLGFKATISGLAKVPTMRLLGIFVTVDVTSRLLTCSVSIRGQAQAGGLAQEFPIWVWDPSTDGSTETVVRHFLDDTVVNSIALRALPEFTFLPNMLIGFPQPVRANSIAVNGITATFGAGTVDITLMAYMIFPAAPALEGGGLPIPSW